MTTPSRHRPVLIVLAVAGALAAAIAAAAVWTGPTRNAVRAYTALLGAANRRDAEAAARLCSERYRTTHPIRPASEGGLVGLPRNIHQNFQVWRAGENVWLCPTNRVGPVYQFVYEAGGWRFDGPVGVLRGNGRVARLDDAGAAELAEPDPVPD